MQLCLTWDNSLTGDHYESIIALPIMIGRAASMNTVVLNHQQVSRQHARLENIEGKIVIVDQGSTNGTLINGQRIKQATLKDGHSFQIGPFTLTAHTLVQDSANSFRDLFKKPGCRLVSSN